MNTTLCLSLGVAVLAVSFMIYTVAPLLGEATYHVTCGSTKFFPDKVKEAHISYGTTYIRFRDNSEIRVSSPCVVLKKPGGHK